MSKNSDQKITTFLWFDDKAEEAAHFYATVFDDARVVDPVRTLEEMASGKGTPMVVTFEIAGQRFMALNGGPQFQFTEAVSLFVSCRDQAEVDFYWERLTEGGKAGQCGWLKDRYGLSWQIIPKALIELMNDPDPVGSARVMQAMLGMNKIDIAALRAAHAGT
jgi:predicted 3-demethylubiquinone-9 3-methyltransferase (glyoxalase superfamily)